jgi:putative FmdB family regulatory protein
MPMFEYQCKACERRFESLVFGSARPTCPSCGSDELEKLLSTFGVGRSAAATANPSPGGCAGCGDFRRTGSCPMA